MSSDYSSVLEAFDKVTNSQLPDAHYVAVESFNSKIAFILLLILIFLLNWKIITWRGHQLNKDRHGCYHPYANVVYYPLGQQKWEKDYFRQYGVEPTIIDKPSILSLIIDNILVINFIAIPVLIIILITFFDKW